MSHLSASQSPVPREARRRGRALAARLTRLASGQHEPSTLLDRAAYAVVDALGGSAAAVFFRATRPDVRSDVGLDARSTVAARLEYAGEARATQSGVPCVGMRQLRAAAWLALRDGQTRVWAARPADMDGTARPGLVALPLGVGALDTVLVVIVGQTAGQAAARDAVDRAAALLHGAYSALGAVARVTYLAVELDHAGRRRAQLQAIFANSSEAIVTVDRNFHLIEVNPAFSALLERDPTDALGKHCSEVLTCQDERGQILCHTPSCPLAQAFALAQPAPYREVFWRAASGKNKEVSASFAPVPAPGGQRGVIIARDISPVNAANRMRANFISMVSHDLRTPLNSINGFLEIVLDGMVGALNPKQEEFLAFALASTHQLMTLVEDVLFISRADSGQFKLRLDTMSITDMVAQCLRNLRAPAQKAQVNLRVVLPDDLPTLYADELRLQQVLTNLVNNAIKFTPPRGTITIEASVDRSALRISVRDTGEGVPVEQQTRIFDRFVQLDADSQGAAGGYGLGLAIARLIVQQHGGRIWVRNAPEGGAIFTFTIPLSLRPVPEEELRDA